MIKLEKIIEKRTYKNDRRPYLGASQIGEPCKRSQWYTFRFCTADWFYSERQKRLFQFGHNKEPEIYESLKSAGVKIKTTQKKAAYAKGYGSSHCDGIITNVVGFIKTLLILLEIKTAKHSKFTELKNNKNLEKVFPEYYVQIQVYMFLFKLKKCLFLMENKDNQDRIYLEYSLDKTFAKKAIKETEKVIFSVVPPRRIGDRNFYRCRPFICKVTGKEELFCEHRDICHNDKEWNVSCRTCKFIRMVGKGKWFCLMHKEKRSLKKQLKACKKYKRF